MALVVGSPLDIEQRLNALDIHAHGLEAEPLIAECFEWGFFPWDNPKFLVFLERTIEANLKYERKWGEGSRVRGGLYARLVLEMLSGDVGMVELYERLSGLLREAEQWQMRRWPDVLYWVRQAERRQNILLTAGFGAARMRDGS